MEKHNILDITRFSALDLDSINTELRPYGFRISDEDLVYLEHERSRSLDRYELVDFSLAILDDAIAKLMNAPYLNQQTFVKATAHFVDAFYYTRAHSKLRLDDPSLVELMYTCYMQNFGIFDRSFHTSILKTLSKAVSE
ncbi:hypothetical protein G7062_06150 [Erysipelothrix sp. HDW6C]|uniref:DUF6323 family protein n=1 Tax=Erysipelothrix sp. HDW6C TaxID=2714930 RepID=UPI00140739EF|nr:DUF6323 family protein [Erysipelothrix sp. HDW6C]QIK69898.1 hypothetical protein G7062_06150 [Erysipelothrix sp. HDW6C]